MRTTLTCKEFLQRLLFGEVTRCGRQFIPVQQFVRPILDDELLHSSLHQPAIELFDQRLHETHAWHKLNALI